MLFGREWLYEVVLHYALVLKAYFETTILEFPMEEVLLSCETLVSVDISNYSLYNEVSSFVSSKYLYVNLLLASGPTDSFISVRYAHYIL